MSAKPLEGLDARQTERSEDVHLLRRLWPFVRPHAALVIFGMLLLLVILAINLARPILMGNVVAAAGKHDRARLLRGGAVLTALVVVAEGLKFFQLYQIQVAGARITAAVRKAVFEVIQRLKLGFIDRTPVGRLVTRATNDVDAFGDLFADGALNGVGDVLALGGYVVAMLLLDWRMSLVAFATLPLALLFVSIVRAQSRKVFRDIRNHTSSLNAFFNEQVSGIAVVQAYGRERATEEEFDSLNGAYRDAGKRSIGFELFIDAAVEMLATLCVASVLLWVATRGGRVGGRSSADAFALVVAFATYIKQFFEPIRTLSQRYGTVQSAMTALERIFEILDQPEVEPKDATPDGGAVRSETAFSFENVTFSYKPGVPVLHAVSLYCKYGEKLALVGATGSGKTTIASLLLRLYEIESGVLHIDGRDVRSQTPSELRKRFAVVPQDGFLFPGTLLSNVAMSDVAPDRERARLALERVGADKLFGARAAGSDLLDMPVDDRGSNFSVGERQLISFARALYRDAPFLILDEATASVDSETEAQLQSALQTVLANRTALIIAHRLSTIRAADRIIALKDGLVVEQGPHDELIRKGGYYANLHQLHAAVVRGPSAV